MKSHAIKKAFDTYLEMHKDQVVPLQKGELAAILFGTDEFKLNPKKRKIRLPKFGWMDVPGLTETSKVSWVGLLHLPNGWNLILGGPYSPFSEEAKHTLPRKNGVIAAIPFAYVTHSLSISDGIV